MTDARLKCEWFGRIDMDDLSDAAWRIFTGALMWSNLNGTDGWIPERYVDRLHPGNDRALASEALAELIRHGLAVKGRDQNEQKGCQFIDWATVLGQSTAEEMMLYKANAAKRASKYRESQNAKLAKAVQFTDATPVTRDVTSDVTRDVRPHVGTGKGKGKGKGTAVEGISVDETGQVNEQTGELHEPASTAVWSTLAIPGVASDPGYCAGCGGPLPCVRDRPACLAVRVPDGSRLKPRRWDAA